MNTLSAFSRLVRRSLVAICLLAAMAASAPAQQLSTYISNLASGSAGHTECDSWWEWVWWDENDGYWEFYEECNWVVSYYWQLDSIEVSGTVPEGEVKVQVTYTDNSVQEFVNIATGGPFYQNIFHTDSGPHPVWASAFQINLGLPR